MKKLCLFTPVILLIGIVSCRQLSEPSESTGAVLIEQPSSDKGVASRDTNIAISHKGEYGYLHLLLYCLDK